MLIGALTAWRMGLDAEGKSLEQLAPSRERPKSQSRLCSEDFAGFSLTEGFARQGFQYPESLEMGQFAEPIGVWSRPEERG